MLAHDASLMTRVPPAIIERLLNAALQQAHRAFPLSNYQVNACLRAGGPRPSIPLFDIAGESDLAARRVPASKGTAGHPSLCRPAERTEVSTVRRVRMATDWLREGVSSTHPLFSQRHPIQLRLLRLWHSYCLGFFAAHETFFARRVFHTQTCLRWATRGVDANRQV